MLGIGESEGLNDSAHCRASARSNPSPPSPTDAASVAGVKSPIEDAELGMLACAELGWPSDAHEGTVGSMDDIDVLGVTARRLFLELYDRHMSRVRSRMSLAMALYAAG